MSEPLSSSDIEDVLSSIRRLVSEDMRPVAASGAAPAGAGERGKLLLTPALRVVQDNPGVESPAARGIDDLVAAVGAGVDQQSDDWEPETGDASLDAPLDAPLAEIWEDVPVIEDYVAPVQFQSSRSEPAVAAAAEPDPEAAPDAGAVSERFATAYVEAVQAESELAGIGFEARNPDPAAPEPGADRLHQADESATLPGWAQSAGADEADQLRPDPWAAGSVEPPLTWADAAEAAVLQELGDMGPKVSALRAAPGDDLPELPVDEAMLREIVRDVLREELQGRLGERITRNIRKLVRAEIARGLASDDLL
ncbi:TIR domain-containing protein [Tabrizicola oligotrophica]|uniref:Uncharacterized protein n=1 Tax=Tabrizicola oligotrophica TaxID=2710650 RepID=A0A6M0QPL0_9RHOB|nr:hypothetical protein [Tabrizicola oligotrophica]NEY89357.1 hypothetical protein [Tabrizicola oligotrophica]